MGIVRGVRAARQRRFGGTETPSPRRCAATAAECRLPPREAGIATTLSARAASSRVRPDSATARQQRVALDRFAVREWARPWLRASRQIERHVSVERLAPKPVSVSEPMAYRRLKCSPSNVSMGTVRGVSAARQRRLEHIADSVAPPLQRECRHGSAGIAFCELDVLPQPARERYGVTASGRASPLSCSRMGASVTASFTATSAGFVERLPPEQGLRWRSR